MLFLDAYFDCFIANQAFDKMCSGVNVKDHSKDHDNRDHDDFTFHEFLR